MDRDGVPDEREGGRPVAPSWLAVIVSGAQQGPAAGSDASQSSNPLHSGQVKLQTILVTGCPVIIHEVQHLLKVQQVLLKVQHCSGGPEVCHRSEGAI